MNLHFTLRSATSAIVVLLMLLAFAPGAFAADGEIGDLGDTDSIGNVYVASNGRAAVKIDYPRDCPTGVSGCSIEVQFRSKCPEVWCDVRVHSWRAIPAPVNGVSTVYADCMGGGDIDNAWEINYRVRWFASTTKTVDWTGELELVLGASGSVNRLIAEAAAVAGVSGQARGQYFIETTTATADYSPAVIAATSGGRILRTC